MRTRSKALLAAVAVLLYGFCWGLTSALFVHVAPRYSIDGFHVLASAVWPISGPALLAYELATHGIHK